MSLFIRCQWLPATDSHLDDRIAEVASLLRTDVAERVCGNRWYRLGMSKRKSLAEPVEFTANQAWRRSPLTKGQVMYRLEVWNGSDDGLSSNLSSIIHEPSDEVDVLVISLGETEALAAAGASWGDVLALADSSARTLGGRAIVSSRELREWAAERSLEYSGEIAYAACWGIDRSGVNGYYSRFTQESRELPYCSVACATWEEVRAPDEQKVVSTASLLTYS